MRRAGLQMQAADTACGLALKSDGVMFMHMVDALAYML